MTTFHLICDRCLRRFATDDMHRRECGLCQPVRPRT